MHRNIDIHDISVQMYKFYLHSTSCLCMPLALPQRASSSNQTYPKRGDFLTNGSLNPAFKMSLWYTHQKDEANIANVELWHLMLQT